MKIGREGRELERWRENEERKNGNAGRGIVLVL